MAAANNPATSVTSTFMGNGAGVSQDAPKPVKAFGDNNIVDTMTGGGLQLTPQQ